MPATLTCPVCTSDRTTVVLSKTQPEGPLVLRRCGQCRHGFLEHQPASFEAHRYEYYRQLLERPREERQTELNAQRYDALLNEWETRSAGRRLLDVGCGDGHLVRLATERGWNALGIDLSEAAIEVARTWGAACEVLDFFDLSLRPGSWDFIHMAELLEHVPEPGLFLARAEQLLVPGGQLYLTTPNFDSLSRRALGSEWNAIHFEHLSYFCPRSLRLAAARNTAFEVSIECRNLGVVALLRRVRQKNTANQPPSGAAARRDDQALRKALYRQPVLKSAMRLANVVLDVTHAGDTIVARMTKRRV